MLLDRTPNLNKCTRISIMSENMEFESEPSIDNLPSSKIVPTIQAITDRAITSMNTFETKGNLLNDSISSDMSSDYVNLRTAKDLLSDLDYQN